MAGDLHHMRDAFGAGSARPGFAARGFVVMSVIGIVIGVTAVLLTTKYMTTLLFGLSERDPATLLAVSTMLLITASVAGFFPARRAATIDPVRAIKTE